MTFPLLRVIVNGRASLWGGLAMAIDPVCKMKVDEKKAAATSEYKGNKYYFCGLGCKRAFDKNPDKYLGAEKK
jgi:YHS domain-containing protein